MNPPNALSEDSVLGCLSSSSGRLSRIGQPLAGRVAVPVTLPSLERAARNRPQHLLDLACKVLGASWGGVGRLTVEGELFDHMIAGASEEMATSLNQAPALLKLFARVLQMNVPLREHVPAGRSAEWSDLPGLPSAGSLLAMPFCSMGRFRGVLYLVREAGQPEFDPLDEETARPICACLEQAGLFEEAHLLAQLRLLNQVIQAAANNVDLSRILAVALRELDRHLPMHRGAVWLFEPDDPAGLGNGELPVTGHLLLRECSAAFAAHAGALGLTRGARLPLEETPFAACVRDGQAVYADLRRPEERQATLAACLAECGATAYFALPMRVGDQTVGLLLSVCQRPTGFTGEQIQLLYLVADLLGPALSNCQMFNRVSAAYEELRQAQGQLVQSEKMRALGELASGMAHDFNNSLCGVLGFLELTLMDSGLPAGCRDYLESARACAQDAAQSVSRVQDFARRRRHDEGWQPLDVNDLARQTVELTRPKWESVANFRQAPITVQVVPAAKGLVKGNAPELRNALTNLVLNAVDAMPQGGTLSLRTWSTADNAFIAVQDTGSGIDPQLQKRLFEPFFSTKGERGTGLGLSAAFGIVQRHDGEITVESAPDHGSTFTIRLPRAELEDRAWWTVDGQPAGHAPSAVPRPPPTLKGLRILVVEDEESIRRFLGNALKQLGHHVRLAPDARAALVAYDAEPFDVVITDLGLPGVSGEEVARAIAERSPRTPVILLTGWAEQIQAEQKTFPGVACVLGKPVSMTTLVATLNKVVSGEW